MRSASISGSSGGRLRAAARNGSAVDANTALLDVDPSDREDGRLGGDRDRRRKIRHLEQQRRRSRRDRGSHDRILPPLLRLVAREDLAGRQPARAGDVDLGGTSRGKLLHDAPIDVRDWKEYTFGARRQRRRNEIVNGWIRYCRQASPGCTQPARRDPSGPRTIAST